MSWTFEQVKARVRSLLDDPDGSYITNEFIGPLINEVYEDVTCQLASTQSSYNTEVIELLDIDPGTSNLSAYRFSSIPLSQLANMPEQVDWKPAGADSRAYRRVNNYEILPDGGPGDGVFGWEFRESAVWITPAKIAVDLRIRGTFLSPALTKGSDVLKGSPRLGYVVAYGTAALIAAIRGNLPWIQAYETKAAEGLDEIMAQIVRGEQRQVRRTGRQSAQMSRLGR